VLETEAKLNAYPRAHASCVGSLLLGLLKWYSQVCTLHKALEFVTFVPVITMVTNYATIPVFTAINMIPVMTISAEFQ
jgi:hypothetical protein